MVEDNPGDVRLIQEALSQSPVWNNPSVVYDGEAALDFVYRRGPYAGAPQPDLVSWI